MSSNADHLDADDVDIPVSVDDGTATLYQVMAERDMLRQYLRPSKPEYLLRDVDEDSPINTVLQMKLERWQNVGGQRFNDQMMANSSFNNPKIYEKLVGFLELDQYASFIPTLANFNIDKEKGYSEVLERAQADDYESKQKLNVGAAKEKLKRQLLDFTASTTDQ